jgi:tetratricopeptide (TPR) repeat protein
VPRAPPRSLFTRAGSRIFEVGDRVFVFGLVNRSDLNGCVGEVVQAVQLESAAALLKSGDGRVGVMMNSSKGKAKESVRIKPENLQLFSRKIATDRVVLPGLRCIIRHHSKAHDRLVVEVVAYDPRTDSVAVRAVTDALDQPPFFVMAHSIVPHSLHMMARNTFVAVLSLIPELRQLDTDLGAAVVTCLKSCGLFFARCCRPDKTTLMIKLALQNYYTSYVFEAHALTKARKYDWFFEYSLIAVNVVTGYLEQHEYHQPAADVHTLCKATFEERNINSMNVGMSFMNIGVMCCRMNHFEEAERNLLLAQKFLHQRGLYETVEASKVTWCLGVCYAMQTPKWARGEQLIKDSLRMKLKRCGRGQVEVTLSMESLITLYLKQNRLKEAEILCKEMWRLREAVLSPYTALYPEALFRIAQLYERLNMLSEGETLCKEALRLRDAHFGWESLAVSETLLLLAVLRARAMRLDESELLLKEVLRIAPLFSSCSGSGGIPGVEAIGAIALQAHIYILRGDTDLALQLHSEALDLKVALYQSSLQPTKPCLGNLAVVWSQNASECAESTAPPHLDSSARLQDIWTNLGAGCAGLHPSLARLFALPEGCAPEVLARWVVYSDLLEARGYGKRRVYEPQNAAAAAWLAAAVDKQEPEFQEAVAEDVIEFFIDRAVQRGQLPPPPPRQSQSTSEPTAQPDGEAAARLSALPDAAVPTSIYQDCLSNGGRDFVNLYASAGELQPGDVPAAAADATPDAARPSGA